MLDKNNNIIKIGDIVRIEGSPIKSDNAVYVVVQDGTSKLYSDKDNLTMYKVAKYQGSYTLSKAKYNICFYPLSNFSNKYKFTREEMNAATIGIIEQAKPEVFEIVKTDNRSEATGYGFEKPEDDYFRAVVSEGERQIEDFTYLVSEADKMKAVFSNIIIKEGQVLEITKNNNNWGYPYRTGYKYILRNIELKKETK